MFEGLTRLIVLLIDDCALIINIRLHVLIEYSNCTRKRKLKTQCTRLKQTSSAKSSRKNDADGGIENNDSDTSASCVGRNCFGSYDIYAQVLCCKYTTNWKAPTNFPTNHEVFDLLCVLF